MRRFHALSAALLVTWATATVEPTNAAVVTVVRRDIGTPINEALKAIEMNDFGVALEKVQFADRVKNKSPYEEYMVAKYLGYIALKQPMPDYAAARAAFDRVIASGGIPDRDRASAEEMAMKLHLGERR
jgi:hypothetical protein